MKKMLIIEDTLRHQMAAQMQFPEAKVVNYDEAYKLLHGARPGDFSAILTDLHFKIEKSRRIPAAPFDPHYPQNMAAIGTQMPFGLAFVLKGVELGVPVALVSDVNHHEDLVTGLLDMFGHLYGDKNGIFIGYRPRGGSYSDGVQRMPNPRFLLLRDACPMAEDMHWDGTQIIREPFPPKEQEETWDQFQERVKSKAEVKDWRQALSSLTRLMSDNSNT